MGRARSPGHWRRDAANYPHPLTPLTCTAVLPLVCAAARQMLPQFTGPGGPLRWAEIRGWVYAGTGLHEPAVSTPGRAVDADDLATAHLAAWRTRWRPHLHARCAALRDVDPRPLTDPELLDHYDRTIALVDEAAGAHFRLAGIG